MKIKTAVILSFVTFFVGTLTSASISDLGYKATDPDTLVYNADLSRSIEVDGETTNQSQSIAIEEITQKNPENTNILGGKLTLKSGTGEEQEMYQMTVKGEDFLPNGDYMFPNSFPNYRAFPILPSGTVDIDTQWTSSLKVRSLSYPTTFNVNITHTLTSQTTKNGYDVVKIEYTYSGSPSVDETGTYKFEEITGNGTAYFAFNEGFIVSKTEHAVYTQETRKVKDTGGYDVLDSKVTTSDMTVELQEVVTN